MEMILDFKKIFLIIVFGLALYLVYTTYFRGTGGKSIEQLLEQHRRASGGRADILRLEIARTARDTDVDVLLNALNHSSAKTRAVAAETLGELARKSRDVRGSKRLIQLLEEDENESVRVAAARALGYMRVRDAFDPLLAKLTNREPSDLVKEAAHKGLKNLTDTQELIETDDTKDRYGSLYKKWKEWYETTGVQELKKLPEAK